MLDPVIQTMPLGMPWPTLDPFLFCVHHNDAYPAAAGDLTPRASLAGRNIGSDFSGTDGWSMYHGSHVPGFPRHPHRGFETISFVRRGLMDHADSLGAAARFGAGDVQWMTAGSGIVHSEMFPLLDTDGPNPVELFQIWLNLPAADKLVPPHFKMLWDAEIPKLTTRDGDGRATTIAIVAGHLGEIVPPAPPPDSWAARPDSDVAIWHISAEAGASWELPPAEHTDTVRSVYVFGGDAMSLGGHEIPGGTGAVVRCDQPLTMKATRDAECLILQGRPIGEPVARYGPFVMNDRAGIEQAFDDYQTTGFGGWPWPRDDPNHGHDRQRFARHADGRREVPSATGPDRIPSGLMSDGVKQRGVNRVVVGVWDFEAGKAYFEELLGAEFEETEAVTAASAELGVRVAIAWEAGVELVSPLSDSHSPLRSTMEQQGEGVIGVVFAVDDADASLAAAVAAGGGAYRSIDYTQAEIDTKLNGHFTRYKEHFLVPGGPLTGSVLVGEFVVNQ